MHYQDAAENAASILFRKWRKISQISLIPIARYFASVLTDAAIGDIISKNYRRCATMLMHTYNNMDHKQAIVKSGNRLGLLRA
jgi:hypothetical protein